MVRVRPRSSVPGKPPSRCWVSGRDGGPQARGAADPGSSSPAAALCLPAVSGTSPAASAPAPNLDAKLWPRRDGNLLRLRFPCLSFLREDLTPNPNYNTPSLRLAWGLPLLYSAVTLISLVATPPLTSHPEPRGILGGEGEPGLPRELPGAWRMRHSTPEVSPRRARRHSDRGLFCSSRLPLHLSLFGFISSFCPGETSPPRQMIGPL